MSALTCVLHTRFNSHLSKINLSSSSRILISTDEYTVSGGDVGKLQQVGVKREGVGVFDNWRLDEVRWPLSCHNTK